MDGFWPVKRPHEAGLRLHDHDVTVKEMVDFSDRMHHRAIANASTIAAVLSCALEG